MFRSRGEHERAIRVHQALALRERDKRKLRQRAMYELGLDFRAAGMPRRATSAMEEVLLEDPGHEGALRALAALYEEQARFNEAAGLWQRLGRRRNEDTSDARAPPAGRGGAGRARARRSRLARSSCSRRRRSTRSRRTSSPPPPSSPPRAAIIAARRSGSSRRCVADPALAPHLLPGLIAAEQGIDDDERAGKRGSRATISPTTMQPKLAEGTGDGELAASPS